jgi:hypothetical protein
MAEKRTLKPRGAATADRKAGETAANLSADEKAQATDEGVPDWATEDREADPAAAAQEAPQAIQAEAAEQVQEPPAEQPQAPDSQPQPASPGMAGPGMMYPPGTAPAQPETSLAAVVDRDEQVIVTVPHNYTLRIDNSSTREFKTGVQKMPRWMAEHWYSKAHGVTVFTG